jgi:hypothetical protein
MTVEQSERRQVGDAIADESGESHNESQQDLVRPVIGAKEGDSADMDQDNAEPEDSNEGYDDAEYIPDFVQEWLDNPPILPGESKDAFVEMFESFEFGYKQRPKTDFEYMLTFQATVAAWELVRFERLKVAIIMNERRSAVESLHRRCAADPSSQDECNDIKKSARNGGMTYFTDPVYRKKFAVKLERAGFASNAVEAAALLRALGPLGSIDRLIKSAEKRLADCLKRLDAGYAARDPEQSMPRSLAASRTEDNRYKRAAKMPAE